MAAHFYRNALTKAAAASLAVAGMLQLSNAAEAAPKKVSQINTFSAPTTFNISPRSSKYTNKAIQVNAKPSFLVNPSSKTKINGHIQIQGLGRTGLTTGTRLGAPDISRKVINGAGLQEIGRANKVIGGMERGRGSAIDHAGLHAPSVQMPEGTCGGMLDALNPGAFISSHDRTSGLQGIGRRSRMEGCLSEGTKSSLGDGSGGGVGEHPSEGENGREVVNRTTTQTEKGDPNTPNSDYSCTSTTTTTYSDGSSTTETETSQVTSWPDGSITICDSNSKESKSATGETYESKASREYNTKPDGTIESQTITKEESKKDANGREIDSSKVKINPNPESDDSYGSYDISGKPDPLGVLKKLNTNRDYLKTWNPTIDPNRDSDHANGNYTGPSIGGITSSNGGTSTGSWYHPYGKGGYTGPSVDAIRTSHGGTSTGDFKPPF